MDKSVLQKHLRPSMSLIFATVFMALFTIVLVCVGISVGGVVGILLTVFFLAITVVVGWSAWKAFSDCSKQLSDMEQSGELNRVLREFESGKQFFKGKLRIGPTYILGKRSGRILTHSQVKKIYQHVHRTNFVEDRRELRVETTDGKTVSVCRLPLRGKGDQELVQAIAIVKTMNPGVYIGYK